MPVPKRVAVDGGLCSRSQTEIERARTENVFSEINSIARVVAVTCNPPTVSASVQQVEQTGFSGSLL